MDFNYGGFGNQECQMVTDLTNLWLSALSTNTSTKTPRHLKVLCLISSNYCDSFKNYGLCLEQSKKTPHFLVRIPMCMKAQMLRHMLQDVRTEVQK